MTEKYPIKATSNILNLLGDELIGSDILSIINLKVSTLFLMVMVELDVLLIFYIS